MFTTAKVSDQRHRARYFSMSRVFGRNLRRADKHAVAMIKNGTATAPSDLERLGRSFKQPQIRGIDNSNIRMFRRFPYMSCNGGRTLLITS